jgi:hypothetical protein
MAWSTFVKKNGWKLKTTVTSTKTPCGFTWKKSLFGQRLFQRKLLADLPEKSLFGVKISKFWKFWKFFEILENFFLRISIVGRRSRWTESKFRLGADFGRNLRYFFDTRGRGNALWRRHSLRKVFGRSQKSRCDRLNIRFPRFLFL